MKSLLLLLSVVPAMRLQNLITLSLGWLTACVALAQIPSRDADRVVIVRNENSPVSRAVAEDIVLGDPLCRPYRHVSAAGKESGSP